MIQERRGLCLHIITVMIRFIELFSTKYICNIIFTLICVYHTDIKTLDSYRKDMIRTKEDIFAISSLITQITQKIHLIEVDI